MYDTMALSTIAIPSSDALYLQTLQAYRDFGSLYGQLLALVSPLAAVPAFLELTARVPQSRPAVAQRTAFVFSAVLLVSLLFGGWLLDLFGGLNCFRCAGGILIFLMGWDMMKNKDDYVHHVSPPAENEISTVNLKAVVPLATPLLAGPGTMSTIIMYSESGKRISLVPAIIAIGITVFIILRIAHHIQRILGVTGMNILNKITGLFTMSLAIAIFMSGLKGLLPGLAGIMQITAPSTLAH